jgi:putative restriction endonuclease
MKYWWVSQGKTYNSELKGGFLWSPQKNQDDTSNFSYEFMKEIQKGDFILSFHKKMLPAISIAKGKAYAYDKPKNFDKDESWGKTGWRVDTDYYEFSNIIKPKDFIDDIKIFLPQNKSPLQRNGNGNQAYLFNISEELVNYLASKIGEEAKKILNGRTVKNVKNFITENHNLIGKNINHEEKLKNIQETDTTAESKSRNEQPILRDYLFGKKDIDFCDICGKELPVSLLCAAHIKKRSKCSKSEKVDINVVMSNCYLGCDGFYEKGFIYVNQNGLIEINNKSMKTSDLNAHLKSISGKKIRRINENNRKYFDFHRKNL